MTPFGRVALKIVRIAAGIVCLLIGLLGLALPILPGWAFIIPGVLILARDVPLFHRLTLWADRTIVAWFERRFPRVRQPIARLREKLQRHKSAS